MTAFEVQTTSGWSTSSTFVGGEASSAKLVVPAALDASFAVRAIYGDALFPGAGGEPSPFTDTVLVPRQLRLG